jgi:basic amino acid/polyamine antiporter, APA family
MPKSEVREDSRAGTRGELKKELGLWEVYCIATGAMFSSGFFLLPGIATAQAGPSTVLAYLLAGLLMVPSMLSMLELATALPRAGGAYYFLDRSLGPAVGTIAGIGSWLTLVLKAAFALVGMGAYLAMIPGLGPLLSHEGEASVWLVKALAVGLTVFFVMINILGAKESTRAQSVLVVVLLVVLGGFAVEGLWYVFTGLPGSELTRQYTPFLHEDNGFAGLFATVGLVFVAFAGLTKVASVSEEVRRPERNLPLGMFLSLGTAMIVYVVGVFIMIAVLDPQALREDLAPVATAAENFSSWLPQSVGLLLVVAAALAAFISTGNAGILSASRYPLAMARDRLLPSLFERIGRFNTPTPGILLTGAGMIFFIVVFSVEGVAKLGSTFNLLIFALVNVAVIVMRESRISTYDPGFRIPLYPWMPMAGLLASAFLIFEMGWLSIGFSVGVIVLGAIWYWRYARSRVHRYGAMHHVFARLGRYRHPELLPEFREIMKEKGLRSDDPYDEIVQRAAWLEVGSDGSFDDLLEAGARLLADRMPLDASTIEACMLRTGRYGGVSLSLGVVALHTQREEVDRTEMVLARARHGVCVSLPSEDSPEEEGPSREVFAVFFLMSPKSKTGQHLRILAQIADRAEDPAFLPSWRQVQDELRAKQLLLRDSRFMELFVTSQEPSRSLLGAPIHQISLPPGVFIASVRRNGEHFEPKGEAKLLEGDALTIIGDPHGIDRIYARYVEAEQEDEEAPVD